MTVCPASRASEVSAWQKYPRHDMTESSERAARAVADGPQAGDETLSIGEAAEACGTTTRTLRYYEEIGLISSSRPTATSQRRYTTSELERIRRIRDLQLLLGLELDEIGEHLAATDRLDGLRAEYLSEPPASRREEILAEGEAILRSLRQRVVERQVKLEGFLAELDGRLERIVAARQDGASR